MLYKKVMGRRSLGPGGELPEGLAGQLCLRLRRHAVWDSLLRFVPPLTAGLHLVSILFFSDLIAVETLIFLAATGLGLALGLGIYYGRTDASPCSAARLIDQKVGGEDRFVTLATIDPSRFPSFLVGRLRDEAAGFLHRVNLKRDFPYRVRKGVLGSIAGSLAVAVIGQLLLPAALRYTPQGSLERELGVVAQKLSQRPEFSPLAQRLERLAAGLQQEDPVRMELRSEIQELQREIEAKAAGAGSGGEGENDLLSRAAHALSGLEQGREPEQRGGGAKNGRRERGDGKTRERSGGGEGETQGDLVASGSDQPEEGRLARDETGGREKGQDGKGKGSGDRLERDRSQGRETGGQAQRDLEGRGPKSKPETDPDGRVPERFYRPGESGERGLRGARYVTVELPEEMEASPASGKAKGSARSPGPEVAVTNVPLPPPASPEARRERQEIPLEYRGLIR